MPNQFGLPTPQEVLANIQNIRAQQASSSDHNVRRQANLGAASDAIFGNSQVKAAQQQQARLAKASQVQALPGESQIDTEMRRLMAVRDEFASTNPEIADKINNKLIELANMKQEQAKLLAEERRQEAEESRKAAAFPTELATKQVELQSKAGEDVNYWRYNTIDDPSSGVSRVNVTELDSLARAQLRKEGYTKGNGPTTEAEAGAGLTTAAKTDIFKSLLAADSKLDALGAVAQKFDPKFLEIPFQVGQTFNTWKEKLGGKVSPQEAVAQQQYHEFRSNSVDLLNRYINEITGAAVGVEEEKRIRKAIPDPVNDSKTEFIAKLRESVRSVLGIKRRAQELQNSSGGKPLQIDPETLDHIPLPTVSDAEVDRFLQQRFGIPPRATNSPAPKQGNIPATGWSIQKVQ